MNLVADDFRRARRLALLFLLMVLEGWISLFDMKETGSGLGFSARAFSSGPLFDAQMTMYPTSMFGFGGSIGEKEFSRITSTYYGVVLNGEVTLRRDGLPDSGLSAGMYFSATGTFRLMQLGSDAQVMIIEREGYRGLFMTGGPVESSGRLCYIDDCSTSQLVAPARLGDPTLQLLVFPPNVNQTKHIHPTLRMGAVLRGRGECLLADGSRRVLEAGQIFMINERFPHSFATGSETMIVIAYHPDSDVGPTDEEHPMLSRTYLRRAQKTV